jgi:anaerobic nitric oxide reductase flavorubredoxin
VNRGVLSSVAGIMEEIKGLGFKNKKAATFGSYGWSGESTKLLSEKLRESGFMLVNDGISELWSPDEDQLQRCFVYGRTFVGDLKKE